MAGSSFLDRPAARLIALACFGLSVAALVYIHRADIWPQAPAPEAVADPDDPFMRCFAERAAQVDDMVREGVIGADQAALFKGRAEALCRAQEGDGAGPPGGGGGPPGGAIGAPPPGVRPPAPR